MRQIKIPYGGNRLYGDQVLVQLGCNQVDIIVGSETIEDLFKPHRHIVVLVNRNKVYHAFLISSMEDWFQVRALGHVECVGMLPDDSTENLVFEKSSAK